MNAVGQNFADVTSVATAGTILATARRARGVETTEISGSLRLSDWQVEALENDQYDRLPGPTFIRGIIRGYAKTLQIDPQPALDAYGRIMDQDGRMTINVPSQNIRFEPGAADSSKPIKLGLSLLTAAVIGGGLWLWYTMSFESKQADATAAVKAGSATTESAPALIPSPSMAPAATATDATSQPVFSAAPAPALQISNSPSIGAGPAEAQLRFTFDAPAWVEVKDGEGAILLSQLNAAGSEQILTGKPPFALVIGNAASVRLVFKDRPVDLAPYTTVSVARFTLQ
ncbi:MAG: helix-turn-helix domain-containing protein [Burkholderiales bacterium]|nr:helix-turn-helix domain-containing protein [Burkholderiales bacterium]